MISENKTFRNMERTLNNWDKNMPYPLSEGQQKAYLCWKNSTINGSSDLEVGEIIWENEIQDFLAVLRKAGVKTFVLTHAGFSTIHMLHAFCEFGCKIVDVTTTIHVSHNRRKVEGLRLSVGSDTKD